MKRFINYIKCALNCRCENLRILLLTPPQPVFGGRKVEDFEEEKARVTRCSNRALHVMRFPLSLNQIMCTKCKSDSKWAKFCVSELSSMFDVQATTLPFTMEFLTTGSVKDKPRGEQFHGWLSSLQSIPSSSLFSFYFMHCCSDFWMFLKFN